MFSNPWYLPLLFLAHLVLLFLKPGWNLKLCLCSRLPNDTRCMLREKGISKTGIITLSNINYFCLIGILKKIILHSQISHLPTPQKSILNLFPFLIFLFESSFSQSPIAGENINPQKGIPLRKSLVAQCVKDTVLSLQWCKFDHWPWNFPVPWAWPKKFIYMCVCVYICVCVCPHTHTHTHTAVEPLKKSTELSFLSKIHPYFYSFQII